MKKILDYCLFEKAFIAIYIENKTKNKNFKSL